MTKRKTDRSGTVMSKVSSRFSLLKVGNDHYKINVLPAHNSSPSDGNMSQDSSRVSRPSDITESEESLATEEEIIESLKGNKSFSIFRFT